MCVCVCVCVMAPLLCRFAHAEPIVAEIHPGDVLFIPALWHHNVTTLHQEPTHTHSQAPTQPSPQPASQQRASESAHEAQGSRGEGSETDNGWSVSVNVFWKGLGEGYYDKKDVYGNRDLVQVRLTHTHTHLHAHTHKNTHTHTHESASCHVCFCLSWCLDKPLALLRPLHVW